MTVVIILMFLLFIELSFYSVMSYDRGHLLTCLKAIETGLHDIAIARDRVINSNDDLFNIVHSELVSVLWRVRVKLTSTIPPEC